MISNYEFHKNLLAIILWIIIYNKQIILYILFGRRGKFICFVFNKEYCQFLQMNVNLVKNILKNYDYKYSIEGIEQFNGFC